MKLIPLLIGLLCLSSCSYPVLTSEDTERSRKLYTGIVSKERIISVEENVSVFTINLAVYEWDSRHIFELVMPSDIAEPGDRLIVDLESKSIKFVTNEPLTPEEE